MPKTPVQLAPLEPLLIGNKTASALCNVSERTWATMISTGQAPPSVKIGGRRLFRLDIVRKWTELNCPKIEAFMQIVKEKER